MELLFVLTKKLEDGRYKVIEKSIAYKTRDCFIKALEGLKDFEINSSKHFLKITYDEYLRNNKWFMKDMNWKLPELLEYDGLSREFFDDSNIYEIVDEEGETDYLSYDKPYIGYDEILKYLTNGKLEIVRMVKVKRKKDIYVYDSTLLEEHYKKAKHVNENLNKVEIGFLHKNTILAEKEQLKKMGNSK